jgi:hypothetical protein
LSKSPEACLFALAHNTEETTTLRVYRTTETPDVDLSTAGWDFGALEEVRYRDPADNPIPLSLYATVELPQRAFDDATEAYNPHGPYCEPPDIPVDTPELVFHDVWAEAVKDALHEALVGTEYPESVPYESEYADYFA